MKERLNQPSRAQIKPYLVRYLPSGQIYARFRAGGKLIQKSLKTDRVTVAELRLGDFMKQERKKAEGLKAEVRGKMTLAMLLKSFSTGLKKTTRSNPVRRSITKNE
jgi:hypothetical protein